jgi:hypothetical protein
MLWERCWLAIHGAPDRLLSIGATANHLGESTPDLAHAQVKGRRAGVKVCCQRDFDMSLRH